MTDSNALSPTPDLDAIGARSEADPPHSAITYRYDVCALLAYVDTLRRQLIVSEALVAWVDTARPVVEAAEAWRDKTLGYNSNLANAVDTYRATREEAAHG